MIVTQTVEPPLRSQSSAPPPSRSQSGVAADMRKKEDEIMAIFRDTYPADDARAWWHRWRLFNLACAELFAYDGGSEWHVSHHRFTKR